MPTLHAMPTLRLTGCAICTLLTWGMAASATAHGQLPLGKRPLLDAQGLLVGGSTSYGLLQITDDGQALWTPEETLGDIPLWTLYTGDGRVVAGTVQGVWATSDWGCSWEPLPEPLGSAASPALARDHENDSHLAVIAADRALWESHDRGQTWTDLGIATTIEGEPEQLFIGAGAWWVKTAEHTLWRSTDPGQSWESVALEEAFQRRLSLLSASPSGNTLYLGAAEADMEPATVTLLALDAATLAVHVVTRLEGVSISAMAEFQEHLWIGVDGGKMFRSISADPDDGFERVVLAPTVCLDPRPEMGRLWGCGRYGNGVHFLSSTDGLHFDGHVRYSQVCPASCPPDTNGSILTPEIWPEIVAQGVGDPTCLPPDEPTFEEEPTLDEDDPTALPSSDGPGCSMANGVAQGSAQGGPHRMVWAVVACIAAVCGHRRRTGSCSAR
ncbi:MAG: hypothetical protein AAFS10_03875 [Myxococcota bacterium]